ncbi:DUF4179 domain-containing protein [Psychrobacillus sp. L4]|uniref:DUF4179 domain-containing protein n=1 Tax=Psychrobacillus sp. L4 TaxID=3236892 RepID=UPI0036F3E3CF
MEKWEEFLTKKQNDDVPKTVELGIQTAFKQLPKKKDKARITGIVAAAVLFLSIIIGSIFSPAMAATLQSIPIVGSLFEWIETRDTGIKTSAKLGISEEHDLELQVNGHKLIMEETMFDGSRLAISYKVQATSQEEATRLLDRMNYKINDESLSKWGSFQRIDWEKDAASNGFYAAIIVLNTVTPLPDKLELSIKTDYSWKQITIDPKGKHTVLNIQKEKQNADLSIIYKDVSIYPSSIILTFDEIQTVDHYVSLRDKSLDYYIVDEYGNNIPVMFGSSERYEFKNNLLTSHFTFILPTRKGSYEKLSIIPTIYSSENRPQFEKLEDLSYSIDLSQQPD